MMVQVARSMWVNPNHVIAINCELISGRDEYKGRMTIITRSGNPRRYLEVYFQTYEEALTATTNLGEAINKERTTTCHE